MANKKTDGSGKGKPKKLSIEEYDKLTSDMKLLLVSFADKHGIAVTDIPLPEGGVEAFNSSFFNGAFVELKMHLKKVEKDMKKKEENNPWTPKINLDLINPKSFYEIPSFYSDTMKLLDKTEPKPPMPPIKSYYSGIKKSYLEDIFTSNPIISGKKYSESEQKTNPLLYYIATTNNPEQMDSSLKEKLGKHYKGLEETFTAEVKKLTYKEELDAELKAKAAKKKANIEAEKLKKKQAEEKKKLMEEQERKRKEAEEAERKRIEEAQKKIMAEQNRIKFIRERIIKAQDENSSDKKGIAETPLLPGMKDEGKSIIVRGELKPRVSICGSRILYDFGEAGFERLDEVGGKGAGLTEMVRLGMPVPEGFTISSKMASRAYSEMRDDIFEAIARVEDKSGRKFGDIRNPLLVSVRSGAKISMPGMMESILNVGVNEEVIEKTDNVLLYAKCYAALMESFGRNIFGISHFNLDSSWLKDVKSRKLNNVIEFFRQVIKDYSRQMPQDPREQLEMAIKAVFDSWNSDKARAFRETEKISSDIGTAVNVQRMVFGNTPGGLTAVVFTRDPASGEKEMYGSFIENAQGEELVSGGNSKPLSKASASFRKEAAKHGATLESKFKDMQDMEMTVEEGKLYLLQTRSGKRTTRAAIKIALDLAKEGVISEKEALMKIKPESVKALKGREIAPGEETKVIGKGTAVSPGIAQGYAVYREDYAQNFKSEGKVPILFRRVLDTADIKLIDLCEGIVTVEGDGNSISHAIVVARSKNRAVVVGTNLPTMGGSIYSKNGDIRIRTGDMVTINANTGEIIYGHPKLIESKPGEETKVLLEMTKKYHGKDFIVVTSNPREFSGVDGTGLLYVPSANMDEKAIELMREAVFGKGTVQAVEQGFYEFYMKAIKRIKANGSPAVLGLSTLQAFESLVPDRRVLRFREKTLEGVIKQTKRMKVKKDEVIGLGTRLNYYGRPAQITNVKETGCSCCSGYELKFLDNGEEEWVHKSAFKRNASEFKPVDMSGHLGGVVSQLRRTAKANPIRVYEAQLAGAKMALKESGKEGITLMEYSGENEITLNGKTYEITTMDDLLYKSLVAAQEAIKNGK